MSETHPPVPFLAPGFTPAERSAFTGFAGNRLDRLSEARADDAVEAVRADPACRTLVMGQGRALVAFTQGGATALMEPAEADAFEARWDRAILLGFDDGAPRLAVPGRVDEERDPKDIRYQVVEPGGEGERKWVDLRSLVMQSLLPETELGMVAQAGAVLAWHANARFCGRCGTATALRAGGAKRHCASCERDHFPRTDPVVIMLATAGDRCLLGRSHHFPPGMYSTLAGFVEAGETLEMAVRRETHEEAGIHVGRVTYHASQPWPFPHSLMIGCYGEALSDTIAMDETELDDCRWFTRDELADLFAGNGPRDGEGRPTLFTPPHGAIARRLIEDWVKGVATT